MTWTRALDEPWPGTLDEAKTLLGGKAANLGVMARDLALPVPPGFVITTDACRAILASGDWPAGLEDELRVRMGDVGDAVGRGFGDATDPLLVSVRSGAPVSMPGMMDTILDLGLTDVTTPGLARAAGDPAFAQACRDRFESSFRSIVGAEPPDDPWQQLRLAIDAVFASWQGDRARAYRRHEDIPDDLGTAVTVQAMVFGNRGATSATGVLFTRDPATGAPDLYGDILFDAQGEDVVAGTHRTEPISVLDARLPEVAAELRGVARRLERQYADLCDIEFTIEDGRLWLLQVRVGKRSPQAALRIAVDMANDPEFPLTRAQAVERVAPRLAEPPRTTRARRDAPRPTPIATGLPASPGLASGPIATDPAAAVRAAEAGTPAILVRAETSPEDVHGMSVAAGVLTSRGGLASHAAVVARGWGIPAVVGADGVVVEAGAVRIGDRRFRDGDVLTIDGGTGEVFEGAIESESASEVVPEVATLLGWAADAGIRIGEPAAPSEPSSAGREASPDDALIAIALKGVATTQAVADALVSTPEAVEPILERLTGAGLITPVAGASRVTEVGAARVADLRARERDAWGVEAAGAALDAFVPIDHRVKEIVTAWQLRDAEAQVMNDHSDLDYDRSVLERLAAVHADARAWLKPVAIAVPRLATYATRLDRATAAATVGDGRFVASPRVDSFHGIWFELHEELISLAGRTRAEEVEAGRA